MGVLRNTKAGYSVQGPVLSPELARITQPPALPASQEWALRAYGASHTGLVRSHNEDHFLIASVTSAIQVVQANLCSESVYFGKKPLGLFVVADGMGGRAGGEQASAIALTAMEQFVIASLNKSATGSSSYTEKLLREGFMDADLAVFRAATQRVALAGMGTTMTAAIVTDTEVQVCHAGDSRAYLLRGGGLSMLTKDHTMAEELRAAGLIEESGIAYRATKHIVTNVIGGDEPGVMPDVSRVEAMVGDKLLLCSDGLTDLVSDDRISEILQTTRSPDIAAYRLIEAALEGGGYDNITAVVIYLDPKI